MNPSSGLLLLPCTPDVGQEQEDALAGKPTLSGSGFQQGMGRKQSGLEKGSEQPKLHKSKSRQTLCRGNLTVSAHQWGVLLLTLPAQPTQRMHHRPLLEMQIPNLSKYCAVHLKLTQYCITFISITLNGERNADSWAPPTTGYFRISPGGSPAVFCVSSQGILVQP